MRLVFAATLLALFAVPAAAEEGPSVSLPSASETCDRLAGHPDDADLGPNRKGIYLDGIDVTAGEPACRRAIAEHPEVRRYYLELGRVIRKRGDDYPQSIDLYRKAGDMGSVTALIGLGLFYEDGDGVDQDYAKAAEIYQQAIDAGSTIAYSNLGSLYEYGNIGDAPDPAKAFDLYTRGAAAGDDSAYTNLAVLYEDGRGVAQDYGKAEELFRKAIASSSADTSAEGKNGLAWFFAMTEKNLAEAEALAGAAVAGVTAGDDWGRASYLDTQAWVRHLLGRDAEAATNLQAAIGLVGDYAAYHDRLGDIYIAMGDQAKAKAAWQKALDLDPPLAVDEPRFDRARIKSKIASAPPGG